MTHSTIDFMNLLYKFKWTEKTVPVAEDNDIYSIIDACPNACEMWKANERSRDGESHRSSSRYYRWNELVRKKCDVPIIKWNVQFFYNTTKWAKEYDVVNRSSRIEDSANRNRGKEIINSPPPTYDQEPTMVAEDDEISKEKEIDKLMALISQSFKKIYKPTNNNLRTSSNTSRANQNNTPRINRGTGYDNQRIWAYSRRMSETETGKGCSLSQGEMLLCKQEEAEFQFNAEQADWRDDIDDEPDDRELEAHYMYMAQIKKVNPDVADNSRPIFDTEPLHKEAEYAGLKKAEYAGLNQAKYDRLIPSEI
ncbi:hypothetical protein Tco_0300997 [Tanacetum coccineum]